MKLQELTESQPLTTEDLNRKAQRLSEFLKKYARPWLDATGQGRLTFYRGVQNQHQRPLFFRQRVRQDRRPLHSSQREHDAYNAVIAAAGGIANRNNAAFVTTDKTTAGCYGPEFVFMALGPIHTTFHRVWRDWVTGSRSKLFALLKDKDQLSHQIPIDPETLHNRMHVEVQKLHDRLAYLQLHYKDQDWAKMRIQEIEDLLKNGDKLEAYVRKEILKEVLLSSDIFSDPRSYDKSLLGDLIIDQKLGLAAEKYHEVMVKADSALLIDPRFYEDFVRSYLVNDSNK